MLQPEKPFIDHSSKNQSDIKEILKKEAAILEHCHDEIDCSICWKSMSQCVTLAPCMHNFCSICFSEYLKSQYWRAVCPICQVEIQSWNKNILLNTLIDSIGELQVSEKEKEMIDGKDRLQFKGAKLKKYEDGSIYFGFFKDNKREGYGVCESLDGMKYEGEWKNDKQNGFGELTLPNGMKYEGEFQDNKFEGQGEFNWVDGSKYKGEWENHKRNGYGEYIWMNGNHYKGEIKDGKLEGKGEITYANGDKYKGDWSDDKRHGFGEQFWVGGGLYKGEFKENRLEGFGEYKFANGGKYKGEWKNGRRHGFGEYFWADGVKDIGQWKDGRLWKRVEVENEKIENGMKRTGFFRRLFYWK